jgi:hypothetical protein
MEDEQADEQEQVVDEGENLLNQGFISVDDGIWCTTFVLILH